MSNYRLTKIASQLPPSVPFVSPETHERQLGRTFNLRLGANENVFGPSPKAIKAMQNCALQCWMYGDSQCHDIRTALAEKYNVGIDNIVVGEGIDALLGYICRLFIEPGRNVVTSKGAYPTFNFHVAGNGGELHFVPFKQNHEDIDALLALTKSCDAVLTYFSNPNNPMGTWHNCQKVQRLIDGMCDGSLLLLDEAYLEFAPQNCAPPIDISNANVLRFRTFSKAYGMAGARIGYCIGQAGLIAQMEKVRNHFGVNRIAQMGAIAALEDEQYLEDSVAKIARGREKLIIIAQKHGLGFLPSAANFVAIDCMRDENHAKAIVEALNEKAIFIRMPGVAPQSRFIRVSVGRQKDLDSFDVALGEVLRALA